MVEQEMNEIMIDVEKYFYNQLLNNVHQMLLLLQMEDQQQYHHIQILKNFDLDVAQLMV